MNEPQIIEGTREEVGEQLQKFPEEQRFRLIALPPLKEQNEDEGPTLAERFAGRIGRFSFEPADLSERSEEYYRVGVNHIIGYLQVLEGTWEELKLHDKELSGKRFRLVPLEAEAEEAISSTMEFQRTNSPETDDMEPTYLTGMGKFAGILPGSEAFVRQNQEELDFEEKKFQG